MGNILAEYMVDDLWNLILHVYVVGYNPEGESIIFIITEDNRIVFSLVTDCYKKDDCDAVGDILDSYSDPKIDLFVWTHPHDDHSVGIEQLLNKYDHKHISHIFIPNGLHALANPNVNYLSKNAANSINYLRSNYCQPGNKGPRRHRNYHQVYFDFDSYDEMKFYFLFKSSKSDNCFPLTLAILGPESVLDLLNTDSSVNPSLNHLSVVYMLDVNGLKFFMTGDLSNNGARYVSDEWFKCFHFLKIPHHGSDEPESFFNRVHLNENASSIAVSTTFLKKNRPVPKILNHYKDSIHNVYVTHDIVNPSNNKDMFGCVHIEYSPILNSIINNPQLSGNAVLW